MQMKTSKGITLIALIITIVVLLILAGVAIGTLEETDIIGRAKDAAAQYEEKKVEENTLIADAEEWLKDNSSSVTYLDFGKAAYEKIGTNPTEISEHVIVYCNSDSDFGMYYTIIYGDFDGVEGEDDEIDDSMRYYMLAYDGDLSESGYPGEANKWYSATSASDIDFSTVLSLPAEIATNKSGKAYSGYEDLCALFNQAVETEAAKVK